MNILVVEDNRAVAQTLQKLCSCYNDVVNIATDGETGLQMADAFQYDLIVLNISLPKLDGSILCQRLRAKGFSGLIFLVATPGEGLQNLSDFQTGADDYLVKPFDAEELIARVQTLLGRRNLMHQPSETPTIQVDQQPNPLQFAELTIVNDELQWVLEELQAIEIGLRQQNQQLEVTQQTIELERQRYQDLFEFAPDPYVVTDSWGTIQEINQAASHLLNIQAQHSRGQSFITFIAPSDRPEFCQRLANCNLVSNWEVNVKPNNGDPIPVLIAVTSIKNLQNESVGWRWSLHDIHHRKQVEAALRESEEKYRTLFNSIDEGFILGDVIFDEGDRPIDIFYIEANAAAIRITGPDLTGRRMSDIKPPFAPEWLEILGRVVRTGDAVRMELPSALLNTWYEFYIFKPDPTNHQRVAAIYKDVSDRKQAELALKQQIKQEYLLADMAQDIRQSLNFNEVLSRTVHRVREWLQTDRVIIFRFRPDWQGDVITESVGADWTPILSTTIFDPCFGDRYLEPYRQGRIATLTDIDTEGLQPCYIELLKKFQVKANLVVPILQGEHLWGLLIAHHCAAPRQWQPAEIALLRRLAIQISIAIQQSELYEQAQREISERQLAEQKIREQAALLDITTDAIFVHDFNHHILYWNRGAERLYGWSASEALGQAAHQLLHCDTTYFSDLIEILFRQGEWRGETRKVTKTGQPVTVETRWTLVRDEVGQPQCILTVDTDITDKKQLEAQFYRSQRLESLGTLASGIVHDLNNILTPILVISQLLHLNQPHLDGQTRQLLKIVEDSVKRGANLLKQILTFTQGTGGDRSPVPLAPVLQEVLNVIRQSFPKSIEICQRIPEASRCLVAADSTYLHQVFMNLCVNARDAMPDGGILSVSLEHCCVDRTLAQMDLNAQMGHYVVVTIADTGVGIPLAVRDRIFDPFFTTKAPGQGTGLGLATVLGIVKNHGGFLQVFSELGEGTQVKVYLPSVEGILNRSMISDGKGVVSPS